MSIPNALTCLRLVLTPCFALLLQQGRRREALIVLLAASLSDALDGYLARRLRQVTRLGKLLDPVADKLMQLTMMLCALRLAPQAAWVLGLHLLRELSLGALGLAALRRTGEVPPARWYGKLCTALLDTVLTAALIWTEMPPRLLQGGLLLCAGAIAACLVLYGRSLLALLRGADGRTPRAL